MQRLKREPMNFREYLKQGFVILDGATGSNLQEHGMQAGDCPETWVLEHPDVFVELQKSYIEAGSDVLYAPTFTCNRIKLAEYGLESRQKELTGRLVELSKRAVAQSGTDRKIYIAGDMTMTGEQLYPVGTLSFEELINVYKEQAALLQEAGVDLFAVETMMSLQECRGALLAIRETCGEEMPVLVTLTFQEDGRTLYGTSPETAVIVLEAMGADAVGLNCSTGPDKMIELVERMSKVSGIPLVVKPNAGLPQLMGGKTVYGMGPEEFAEAMMPIAELGATVLGGCCGTTPEHIRCLKERLSSKEAVMPEEKKIRALTNERNFTQIELDGAFSIVGERINPTGKKALQAELKEGKLELVVSMAEEQVERGAKILDVNMGMNGIDEKEMMLRAIYELTLTVDVPLSIDSSYVDVVEEALRIYPGRALINSISLEPEKFEKLIPAAKKYGAMFILLPLSEKGLPKDLEEKKQIINTILTEAKRQGLSEKDIVVDGLVATIGANKKAALEVLETIQYCKNELGVATICGLSNISFGLPERSFVNSAFLTMAIREGLTMAIANPGQTLLTNAALASDLLLNKPGADLNYINGVCPAQISSGAAKSTGSEGGERKSNDNSQNEKEEHPLFMSVVKGKDAQVVELVKKELAQGARPAEVIDTHLIPAINYVGELFEKGTYFLPQLISSAETMEQAIDYLEPLLAKERGDQKLDTIVMATVKGDIHDIGKNLVVLMLKNYGYDVIDLGKDVDSQRILDTARETGAAVIGLSALMTTTMTEMKNLVEMAKEQKIEAKIVIGGAVVTESYAEEIGADGYSKDAREAVKLVNRLLGR
ncbi:MAG: homocysteine S-methyltransferase family protein [Roseburia sp.]|nr:homocysteine S-methyltransferase family protein [Roseburia sp.]